MSSASPTPFHTFPDHAIGHLQAMPPHLRELVQAVAPEVAEGLAFEQAQALRTKLQLPDWRQVDTDLLFEVPFGVPGEEAPLLVGVMIEHQSGPDPIMPFRALQYATAYWTPQVQAWRQKHARGERLRLKPILLLVLHTGREPWDTNRSLADLIECPEALRPFQPDWELHLFDLPARSPEQLLSLPGEWLPALTLVRVEHENEDVFYGTFKEVVRRLAPLSAVDKTRWLELHNFLLAWGQRRRAKKEHARLLASIREAELDVTLKEEIEKMADLIEKTWEQEVMEEMERRLALAKQEAEALGRAEGKAEGRAEGRAEGKQLGELQALRDVLRTHLEGRFGPLPETWLQRIELADNPDQLKAASVQVLKISQLDELQL